MIQTQGLEGLAFQSLNGDASLWCNLPLSIEQIGQTSVVYGNHGLTSIFAKTETTMTISGEANIVSGLEFSCENVKLVGTLPKLP